MLGSKPIKVQYKADLRDPVDKMLADFINQFGCPVRIERLGNGYYMFGTRKIFAKIINDKLVIRVGGGYMSIEEFVRQYGKQEFLKVQRIEAGEAAAHNNEDEDGPAKIGDKRSSVMGIAESKKNLKASSKHLLSAEESEEQKSLMRGSSNKKLLESPGKNLESSLTKGESFRNRASTVGGKKISGNDLIRSINQGIAGKTGSDKDLTEFNIRADKSNEKRGRIEKSIQRITALAKEFEERKEKLSGANNFNPDWQTKIDTILQKLADQHSKSSTLKESLVDMKSDSYDMNKNKQTDDPAVLKKLVTEMREHSKSIEDFEKFVNTLQNEAHLLVKVMDKKLEGGHSTETAIERIEKAKSNLAAAIEKQGDLIIQIAEIDNSSQTIASDPNVKNDKRKQLAEVDSNLGEIRNRAEMIVNQTTEAEEEYTGLQKIASEDSTKVSEEEIIRFEENINIINSTIEELVNSAGEVHTTLRTIYRGGKAETLTEIRENAAGETTEKANEENGLTKASPAKPKSTLGVKIGVKVIAPSPIKDVKATTVGARASIKTNPAVATVTASSANPSKEDLYNLLKGMESVAKSKKDTGGSSKFETIKIPKKK